MVVNDVDGQSGKREEELPAGGCRSTVSLIEQCHSNALSLNGGCIKCGERGKKARVLLPSFPHGCTVKYINVHEDQGKVSKWDSSQQLLFPLHMCCIHPGIF